MLRKLKTLRNVVVVVLTVSLLVMGCGTSNEVEVYAKDSGSRIELEKGQILAVVLASNPSTGYRWEVVECEESILLQQGEAEFGSSDTRDRPPPGSGGTETFRFEAQSVGEVSLKLIYHRSWEEEVEPVETFTLQVEVR